MDNGQQALQNLLGGSQSGQFMSNLQGQLQFFFIASSIVSVIIIILLIINFVYKWRVQVAILRMDKNLQILVDNQKVDSNSATDTK
ncbi:MAG: hypothetical protein JWN75_416 [Candidatus Saccharibacteria bacterium]|nr:hypothetical protein [Candidatus Saccharibacteria bacterium]